MRTKFVIVGAPRTGSTLLVRTLNSLNGLCCHGELLGEDNVRGYEDGVDLVNISRAEREARSRRLLEDRNSNPVAFIEQALALDYPATGFKALYNAFLNPRWREVITFLQGLAGIQFIHLTRSNDLRRFISEQILLQGGPNHSAAGGKSDVSIKVHIDIDLFLQRRADLQRQANELAVLLSRQQVLEISYEELAADTAVTVGQVCNFLGVDIAKSQIRPALNKVGAADLRDSVSNYQELLDHASTRELALAN
jgi:LPS sulfotransferase NodH